MTACSVSWCERDARTRGLCLRHYSRARRHGHPEAGGAYSHEPMADRIRRFSIEADSGCWEWQLAVNKIGYGIIGVNGGSKFAHRMSYLSIKGPIPEGLELDHLCCNKRCVNPDHLEPVTRSENVRRGWKQRTLGTGLFGEKNPRAKLTRPQVARIRRLYADGFASQQWLGAQYGVSQTTVGRIVRGEAWPT